ncbi:glycoside hydrolase family 79 protein [Mycena maculata]|uniref:Glycoside hydrolase family 79 protein n=1 Tax=Mycena maculata TaxID=230809 RepID=A0AAD7IS45_9AGAR|nr:glycoside hydrolase family 79 protein [Mycena maculata]
MYSLIPFFLLVVLQTCIGTSKAAVQVTVPATPLTSNVVDANFLGISFELSYIPQYFGNDTSTINVPMLNYLAGIRVRTGSNPVRLRIGGNSADDSPYISELATPMVQLENGTFNDNDQSVVYNQNLWKVLAEVSQTVDGVAYLINIPLAIPPNASLSTDIRNIVGDSLDGMLLGNEPDLYTGHGKRPNLKNYTVADYFGDYRSALNTIGPDDSNGHQDVGGPGICCNWDLATLLQQGFLSNFSSALKYINVQHYPENNCGGPFPYQLPWFLQHSNVVNLAGWQKPGIDYLLEQPAANRPQLINSEFNSASCGGLPFSPSFAVGSLWTIDYALQMASVGYSQAYIHTREEGIPYNLLTPPLGPAGTPGAWTTNAPYYSLLVMAEGLLTDQGGIVADLNLGGSTTNPQANSSAYAVYDAGNKTVSRLIIFNYGNTSTEFAIPSSVFSSSGTALVKFLAAATPQETTNISWGGETWGPGVTDGKTTVSPSWAVPNVNLSDCSNNGCSFTAPGPSLAMVFLDNAQSSVITVPSPTVPNNSTTTSTTNKSGQGPSSALTLNASLTTAFSIVLSLVSLTFLSL